MALRGAGLPYDRALLHSRHNHPTEGAGKFRQEICRHSVRNFLGTAARAFLEIGINKKRAVALLRFRGRVAQLHYRAVVAEWIARAEFSDGGEDAFQSGRLRSRGLQTEIFKEISLG